MNLDAVALFGRANIEKPQNSPFSPVGSGICVHPDGVIATCWHTFVHFMERWSPYEVVKSPSVRVVIEDAERQERPFFFLPSRLAWTAEGNLERVVFPMMSIQGDQKSDIALVELGGEGRERPLPFVPVAQRRPTIGEMVNFAGYFQSDDALADPEGNVLGWRLSNVSARVVACEPAGFLIDYPVLPGMSGSGVCDERGVLLGLISELWPPTLSAERVGIPKSLGFVAFASLLIPLFLELRGEVAARVATGGVPWCGLVS